MEIVEKYLDIFKMLDVEGEMIYVKFMLWLCMGVCKILQLVYI